MSKHESYKNDCINRKKLLVKDEYVEIFNLLKKALLAGNKELFYTIVEKNLNIFNNDIFVFIEQLINPLMYEVGYMWQYNQISVAKEHLATTLTHDIIDKFFLNNIKDETQKPLVLISTIGEESHNLGVKIVGEFLVSKKFDVKNLGSKISNKELISSVYELKPELLILSVTLISNLEKLQKIIKELNSDKNVFKGYIIVGGQALFKDDKPINIEGVDCICKDLKTLDNFLNKVF
ncbi:MAG: cobalamin-dependent protein [Aliarcobacter sp.]|nr:cobalamin-dependent protein [Aliarcobacter sp.]